jgi:hypothetical protein
MKKELEEAVKAAAVAAKKAAEVYYGGPKTVEASEVTADAVDAALKLSQAALNAAHALDIIKNLGPDAPRENSAQ